MFNLNDNGEPYFPAHMMPPAGLAPHTFPKGFVHINLPKVKGVRGQPSSFIPTPAKVRREWAAKGWSLYSQGVPPTLQLLTAGNVWACAWHPDLVTQKWLSAMEHESIIIALLPAKVSPEAAAAVTQRLAFCTSGSNKLGVSRNAELAGYPVVLFQRFIKR